jgi:phage terminase large subunit-like protein
MRTSDNAANLSAAALAELHDRYEGTRLGRQELEGEFLLDVEGALWTYAMLDRSRVQHPPALVRTVVGVDPANTTGTTGIVVVGLGIDGHIYILADASKSAHPEEWASTVAAVALEWDAQIVAESDSGGLMVEQTLRSTGTDMPVHVVTARGSGRKHAKGPKAARAEPIAVLWETEPAKAHLVGALPKLEDQLCSWDGAGKSPDRMDAMVHAAAWLRNTGSVKVKGFATIDVG